MAMPEPMEDRIGALVAQWREEAPGLDLDTMRLAARLMFAGQLMDAKVGELAREYGLTRGEGDVIFTLRRSGAPYRLSPSRLADSLLVATGTMTNRLDRLEEKGLVERSQNPDDRRGFDVALTARGRKLADEAVVRHVDNEAEVLTPLTKAERRELERLLRKLGA